MRLCPTLSHKKHMSIKMRKSKHLNPFKILILKVKPRRNLKYLPTYLPIPTYPRKCFINFILTKIQKCHVAYSYHAMCHNLTPLKIDDKDPPSIFKTLFSNLFSFSMCHYVSC